MNRTLPAIALVSFFFAACAAPSDRVAIGTDTESEATAGDLVQSRAFALKSPTGVLVAKGMDLVHLSTMPSPKVRGKRVQATDVQIIEDKLYAVFNMQGEDHLGALQVYSIDDPKNPRLITQARVKTADFNRIRVVGEYIYVAAGDTELFATLEVLRFNGKKLSHLTTLPLPGWQTTMLDVHGTKAYTTVGDRGGLSIIDLADPENPVESQFLPMDDARFVQHYGDNELIVVRGGSEAAVMRRLLPDAAGDWGRPIAEMSVYGATVGAPTWGAVSNDAFYLSADEGGLIAYSLGKQGLIEEQTIATEGDSNGLAISPDTHVAFLANGQEGLIVLDLQDPKRARRLASFDVPDDLGSANAVGLSHDLLALADGLGGVKLMSFNLQKVPGRVVTVVLTLSNPGIPRTTASRLAKQAVDWVTPQTPSKILVIRDDNHNGEFAEDTQFVVSLLQEAGYSVDYREEPKNGLELSDFDGYDVVWFSNPGYPLDDEQSFNSLVAFSERGGGVVLQGDDTTWARGFHMSKLTRLKPIDNGTRFCGTKIDNNKGDVYRVTFTDDVHPVSSELNGEIFTYGDDIDRSLPLYEGEQVLAWATLNDEQKECDDRSPAIVAFSPTEE